MNKTIKKIWNILTWILISIIALLAIALAGVRAVGLKPYAVLSGSMEPKFHVGSIVYVKSIDEQKVKVGDPITFYLGNSTTIATHRVVQIDNENKEFYTKGDANESVDKSPVKFDRLIGKAEFSIPKLGYLSDWISRSPGKKASLLIAVVVLIFVFVPDIVDKICGTPKEEEKDKSLSIK